MQKPVKRADWPLPTVSVSNASLRAALDRHDAASAALATSNARIGKLLKTIEPVCSCPRECTCKNPELRDPPGIGEIHGDCPMHGDADADPALFGCTAKKHWWQ